MVAKRGRKTPNQFSEKDFVLGFSNTFVASTSYYYEAFTFKVGNNRGNPNVANIIDHDVLKISIRLPIGNGLIILKEIDHEMSVYDAMNHITYYAKINVDKIFWDNEFAGYIIYLRIKASTEVRVSVSPILMIPGK